MIDSLRNWQEVARCIDHTLLRSDATREQVLQACHEAVHFGFAVTFVHPAYVALSASALRGTQVKVGTPIGFPQGAHTTTAKRYEAEEVLRLGARELDMVINIGALKSRDGEFVRADIRGVAEVAHSRGAILKVILETPLLTNDEKILACQLAVEAGVDFVKTATGLNGGATLEDIHLMCAAVGSRAKVKASGGIRNARQLTAFIKAGAQRIGTSSSVAIMRELGAADV